MHTLTGYFSLGKAGRPNEDRFRLLGGGFVLPDQRHTAFKEANLGEIYAVMDGVGGASKGMAAAQYIADQLVNFYTQANISKDIFGIESILNQANQDIFSWGIMEGTNRSIGASTVTLVYFSPEQRVYLLHAGDSCCFLLSQNGFKKITKDHENTLGIYRFIGQGKDFVLDKDTYVLVEGDALCLVTDGITKGLKTHEIQAILEDYAGEPDLAAKHLVETAKRRHVRDDITALVVELEEW